MVFLACSIVYAIHYLSGIKNATRSGTSAANFASEKSKGDQMEIGLLAFMLLLFYGIWSLKRYSHDRDFMDIVIGVIAISIAVNIAYYFFMETLGPAVVHEVVRRRLEHPGQP